MTWIVVGASSGLGRALAERLAADRRSLVLVARDSRDLSALASDLRSRFGADASWCATDAADLSHFRRTVRECVPHSVPIDGLLFALGAVSDHDRIEELPDGNDLFNVNFLSVVDLIREFLPDMMARGKGTIVGFGSVAAARGRSRNVIYSASKAALERFFESLRHGCDPKGVVVQFYVLGYLDTGLAFGRKLLLPKADPVRLANQIVRNLTRGGDTWYLPRFWKPIALAVRYLPWAIFRRLKF